MSSREITTQYRLSQWTQMVRERSASGKSIKEFCEDKGIKRSQYFYWQRKLREAASRELLPVANASGANTNVPGNWVMCETAESATKESSISIEIGRCRITADAGVSDEQLERVCRILMTLC